jgi:hypothetical protein
VNPEIERGVGWPGSDRDLGRLQEGRALLEACDSKGELTRTDLVMLIGSEARAVESAVERYLSLRELANEAAEMLE